MSKPPIERDDGLCWRLTSVEPEETEWTERLMQLCFHTLYARMPGLPLAALEAEAIPELVIYADITASRDVIEGPYPAASRFLVARYTFGSLLWRTLLTLPAV